MRTEEAWKLDRHQVLSVAEADALISHVRSNVQTAAEAERDAALLDELIVVSLLLSGLRNSEFCELSLGDAVWQKEAPRFVVRGHGGAGRSVHIPGCVSSLVGDYVEDVRPGWLPEGVDPEDRTQPLVFNERRRPFERTGLYRRVVRILRGAGFGDRASVQLLRHTYGYLAYLRTGGNLLFVQRQLGHAHPRITSVYAELVDESYAEMAERVAGEAELTVTPSEGRVYEQCRPAFDCEID